MPDIRPHIDRLRTLVSDGELVPTVEQVATITDDVFHVRPLEVTLERPELTDFSVRDVVNVAETFGKFRARSRKGAPKADTITAEEFCEQAGMLFAPSGSDLREWNARAKRVNKMLSGSGKRMSNWSGQPMPAMLVERTTPLVIVPNGYDKATLGRNVQASLAALVVTEPDAAEVERFWNRTYSEKPVELTAEHIYLVWWLSQHNLGWKLDELGSEYGYLAASLTHAYDVAQTYRRDALAAAHELVALDTATVEVETLNRLVQAASWLHHGQFAPAVKATRAMAIADSERLRSLLGGQLRTLARWLNASASGLSDIHLLNEGHVQSMVALAGLSHEAADERRARTEMREKLVAIGLEADLDMELPAAVAAWRSGLSEEFLESRKARIAGDPDWHSLYEHAA